MTLKILLTRNLNQDVQKCLGKINIDIKIESDRMMKSIVLQFAAPLSSFATISS